MAAPTQTAEPSDNLYVQGLPLQLDEAMLKQIFLQYGTVRQCKLMNPVAGKGDLVALIRMGSVEEAQWCVDNLSGNIPSGLTTPVVVNFSTSRSLEVRTSFDSMVTSSPFNGVTGGSGLLPTGVMLRGKVRRWNIPKGFGFIVPDGGGPDVFVHARELTDGEVLVQGAEVMFEAGEDPAKGPGMYRAKVVIGAIPKEQLSAAEPINDNLFITGLPQELTDETIAAVFSQYGSVVSVKKLPSQAGKVDTAALVRMGEAGQAKWLVDNVNGNIPNGLAGPVTVSYAEKKVGGGPRPPPQLGPVQVPPPARMLGNIGDVMSFGKAPIVLSPPAARPQPYGAPPGQTMVVPPPSKEGGWDAAWDAPPPAWSGGEDGFGGPGGKGCDSFDGFGSDAGAVQSTW